MPDIAEQPTPSNMPPVGGTYAKYVLGVLVLVYMVNFIDRSILSILAEDIKHDLGLSDSEIGFLYGTAFAVFYALFGIPLGRLADNWVRTRLLSLGLAVWSSMTALSGFSTSFLQLSAARIGVGIGEASASPSAFSMLSDWFPKERRGTALAIYSSGIYIGGGVSLLIGAVVVRMWNSAYPGGGPMGLAGWQAAFLAVGLPGLLLAVWVATLKEPIRGRADGLPPPAPVTDIGKRFFNDLASVLPPLTLFHVAQFGPTVLLTNIAVAGGFSALAALLIYVSGDVAQWVAVCMGAYAIASWSQSLRHRDRPTFALIWGTPAFILALVGFGLMSFIGYASAFWAVPYAIRTFVVPMAESGLPVPFYATTAFVALTLGGMGAAGGFIGVVLGGWISDLAKARHPSGRIITIVIATTLPLPFYIWMFTTDSLVTFFLCNIPLTILGSVYPGIAAATTQDLVLPRMRGAATATYFIGTTLLGLGIGPYFAGAVSKMTGDLGTGILSLLLVSPISLGCMYLLYHRLPHAESSRVERARAVGEPI